MLCISKNGIHGDTKMVFMETQKWYLWRYQKWYSWRYQKWYSWRYQNQSTIVGTPTATLNSVSLLLKVSKYEQPVIQNKILQLQRAPLNQLYNSCAYQPAVCNSGSSSSKWYSWRYQKWYSWRYQKWYLWRHQKWFLWRNWLVPAQETRSWSNEQL